MTNKEAIEELKKVDTIDMPARLCEAHYMAIKALEQEPCGDAISRQAVLDLVSKFILEIHSEGGRDLNAHTNDVLRQILRNVKSDRVLPPVNPQEPQWIPVSERLPKKEGRYLTTILNEHDNRLRYVMTCDYFSNGCWCPDDECASSNVIAWMPLPPCFEPQESEEV